MSASLLSEKLAPILEALQVHRLDAYWVPSADEHLNEYLPAYRKRLEWASGFSGSAGTFVICREGLHSLFVDSRYHIQAEQETSADEVQLHKMGLKGSLSPEEWLRQSPPMMIGIDPFLMSPRQYKRYEKMLSQSGSKFQWMAPNWVDSAWTDAPCSPLQPIYELPFSVAGETVASKLERVRQKMKEHDATLLVLTRLDEIAWLSNLRGSDIQFNPVFEAYGIVHSAGFQCFAKVLPPSEVIHSLKNIVEFHHYDDYGPTLKDWIHKKNQVIWLDASGSTIGTQQLLQASQEEYRLVEEENPIVLMKALKNETELEHMRQAHHHSACAKIRSFIWLEDRILQQAVTEKDYADRLQEDYAKAPGFADLSFATIAGFAANSAIVHYGTPDAQKKIEGSHLFLVDSGVQILGGTTDDTRTLIIGTASRKHQRYYTLVLQSHIRLAMQSFPEGTKGTALDAIARSNLWNVKVDYGHGTGHGVGAFLNVHEGPQSISPLSDRIGFQSGMIISNEPGYYEEGWGGIRLENLYEVVAVADEEVHPSGKPWLQLIPLTLIPFDRALIDPSLLNPEELSWLNRYHQRVIDEIGPLLLSEEALWLRQACMKIV